MSNYVVKASVRDKRGRMLAVAFNSYTKTHPYQAKIARLVGSPERIYLHAEIAAIISSAKKGDAYSIHVERYDAMGNSASAAPCEVCRLALELAGIKHITHT